MKVKHGITAGILGLFLALSAVAATVAPSAKAAPPSGGVTSVITPGQSGGVLNGTFTITSFSVNDANELVANGVFTGTANGVPVTSPASAPVSDQQPGGTCQILDLTLGPLHLDLLGLVVDLNQVHLTITAERGPGNLLGNLLCAIAGLLDGGGIGPQIQQLLNQINAILGRL